MKYQWILTLTYVYLTKPATSGKLNFILYIWFGGEVAV